jgi:hypothetical protein
MVVALAVVMGCEVLSPNGISTGTDGLRTFNYQQSVGGAPVLCTLEGAVDPVTGVLDGHPTDRERVWLNAGDGRRLSVVWPKGFTVRFEPHAVLVDEGGGAVARAGDPVVFGQVNFGEHQGTFADPYFARGIVFRGCYPRPH